jgi:hypothetical protein
MSLSDFSRDVVPILQLGVAGVGLVSFILIWYQIKQAAQWNRVATHNSLLSYLPGQELEKDVLETLAQHSVPRDTPIPMAVAAQLFANPAAFVRVKTFLNKYEHFCAAINAGAVDEQHAYALHCGRVVVVHSVYRSFIEMARVERGPMTFIEVERVATRWAERRAADSKKLDSEIQRLKSKGAVSRQVQ